MKKSFIVAFILVSFNHLLSQKNCLTSRFEYLESNPDVKKIAMDPWGHFQNYGKKEGRVWPECLDDDSLQKMEFQINSLESKSAEIQKSIQEYSIVNGQKWFLQNETVKTYLAFRYCDVYYLDNSYYQKKQSSGIIKIAGFPVYLGIVEGDRYFAIDSKNQQIAFITQDIFNSGRGWAGRDNRIKVESNIYWYSNDSLPTIFKGLNESNYSIYDALRGAKSLDEYKEMRFQFFEKLSKEIIKNKTYHPLTENQKQEWLKRTTNLDDNYFILSENLTDVNKELKSLNDAKSVYISQLINNRKIEEQKRLAKIEEERLAQAFELPGLVKIGNDYWQRKNCSITKYMNGDRIFFAQNSEQLYQANQRKEGAYCFINFNNRLDSSNIVYNYYAIMDPRGFGTSDLRVASMQDWNKLLKELEKNKKTFNDLKKVDEWDKNNNIPMSNYFGFDGVPTFSGWGTSSSVNWRNCNDLSYWIPDSYISFYDKKDDESYLVTLDNSRPLNANGKAYKENMYPIRLIKGEATYFAGKVVKGKKEGQGRLYVRTPSNRADYVNPINVQTGAIVEGNWINDKIEGNAKIILPDGISVEGLFINNNHQGNFKIYQNTTQICLYDGKTFNSKLKKTPDEIESEKSNANQVIIKAYKTELYCSSACASKAHHEAEEKLSRQQSTLSNENKTSPTPSNSNSTSGSCSDCNGAGICKECNKTFSKEYHENGATKKRSAKRLGYVLCQSCYGRGYQSERTYNGAGFQEGMDCRLCDDGWVPCKNCNSSGRGSNIGSCQKCKGTGRKN